MPDDIRTDARLLERLKDAAGKPLTQDEIREQRVSFIRGSVSAKNLATRARIEEVLSRLEDGE